MESCSQMLIVLSLTYLMCSVAGHGRLMEPPSRASMFRHGFDNPPDAYDNQSNCGGYQSQLQNGGKCGICGDSWNLPVKPHEAGGIYANGIIVKEHVAGQDIEVDIELTSNHKGYFEFRLCVHNNVKKKATQQCLDENLLQLSYGSGSRFYIADTRVGHYKIPLKLPKGVVCTQCVFQWRYHAGNSWGLNPDGSSCIGCGQQEEFYACSDIAISAQQASVDEPADDLVSSQPISATPIVSATKTTTKIRCLSHGVYKSGAIDHWCKITCAVFYCPKSHCVCI